jgi:hypothetical protein
MFVAERSLTIIVELSRTVMVSRGHFDPLQKGRSQKCAEDQWVAYIAVTEDNTQSQEWGTHLIYVEIGTKKNKSRQSEVDLEAETYDSWRTVTGTRKDSQQTQTKDAGGGADAGAGKIGRGALFEGLLHTPPLRSGWRLGLLGVQTGM